MPARHDLQIEGHQIVALEYNANRSGTAVIAIHGIMSSVGFWNADEPLFNGRHWFSLSLPGHYPAVLPDGFQHDDLTAESMARVLIRAVQQLVGKQPVILVGHSTGAFAALMMAALAPEMVQGVVSIAGFAQGKWHGLLGLLQRQARMGAAGEAMFRLNVKSGVLHPRIAYLLSSLYAGDRWAYFSDAALYRSIQAQFVYTKHLDASAMAHYFNRMPEIDVTDWLAQIQAPTLVICGDHDPIVPATQSALIASTVEQGELVMIAGAGHMVMVERPAQYQQVISDWLQTHMEQPAPAAERVPA